MSEDAEPDADRHSKGIHIGLLGIRVTPLTALEAATVAVRSTGKTLILNHNLHSAYLHDIDLTFRHLYQRADWIVVDGAPILWLASLKAKQRRTAAFRITSTDWIEMLPSINVARRLFVYGATSESNERAIETLRKMLPDWHIEGINGYVAPSVAVGLISDFKPNLVLVGMGMPRQEYFLEFNYDNLPDATYATVGGAVDYLAGATRLAPRWIGRFGLEWAWRLVNEPRRLAFRYLVEPLQLVGRATLRTLRLHR